MKIKYYTGIGARETPKDILDIMFDLAKILGHRDGYVLRSGGAGGADSAFQEGCEKANGEMNIYYADDCTSEAMAIAAKYHSNWETLSLFSKKLHGRNALQVLGLDLKTPSKAVVCWTPCGATHHKQRTRATGGTGTAISIASMNGIPIFNLKNERDLNRITSWIGNNL